MICRASQQATGHKNTDRLPLDLFKDIDENKIREQIQANIGAYSPEISEQIKNAEGWKQWHDQGHWYDFISRGDESAEVKNLKNLAETQMINNYRKSNAG